MARLIESVGSVPGVDFIHLSHIAIAPVAYDPKAVEMISPLLLEKTRYNHEYRHEYKDPFVTALFGIESGSVRIMKKYMRGKIWPFPIEQYHEVNVQGAGILNDNGWKPMATLISGWPDETPYDTVQSLELIDKLKGLDLFLVPLLFIPLEDTKLKNERRVSLDDLTPEQWDFFAESWRFNIDVWAKPMQPLLTFASLFSYFTYFRWKHGKKVFRPIMKIANLPLIGGMPEKFPPRAPASSRAISASTRRALSTAWATASTGSGFSGSGTTVHVGQLPSFASGPPHVPHVGWNDCAAWRRAANPAAGREFRAASASTSRRDASSRSSSHARYRPSSRSPSALARSSSASFADGGSIDRTDAADFRIVAIRSATTRWVSRNPFAAFRAASRRAPAGP